MQAKRLPSNHSVSMLSILIIFNLLLSIATSSVFLINTHMLSIASENMRWIVPGVLILLLLCIIQFISGIYYLIFDRGGRLSGLIALLSAPVFACGDFIPFIAGAAWGRPLRVRGRQLHPTLRKGSDWTSGPRPDSSSLNESTRQALAALWLHDAQKEHASVPAFSRISWLLAAVGAPAELMEWSHRAALEEINHTRLCFALAAGYAGHSYTVEPMPDLLLGGLDIKADPLVVLATESLSDGCLLEDFNADVADACAAVCQEPATRMVLEQITREERSHADFSWALLDWLLACSPGKIYPVIERTLLQLESYPRPTAVSWDKQHIVAQADPIQMLSHGRLPDCRWQALWDVRLIKTRKRLSSMIEKKQAA